MSNYEGSAMFPMRCAVPRFNGENRNKNRDIYVSKCFPGCTSGARGASIYHIFHSRVLPCAVSLGRQNLTIMFRTLFLFFLIRARKLVF